MKIGDVVHGFDSRSGNCRHGSLIPACFSMLLSVPVGMCRFGCGTPGATHLLPKHTKTPGSHPRADVVLPLPAKHFQNNSACGIVKHI